MKDLRLTAKRIATEVLMVIEDMTVDRPPFVVNYKGNRVHVNVRRKKLYQVYESPKHNYQREANNREAHKRQVIHLEVVGEAFGHSYPLCRLDKPKHLLLISDCKSLDRDSLGAPIIRMVANILEGKAINQLSAYKVRRGEL